MNDRQGVSSIQPYRIADATRIGTSTCAYAISSARSRSISTCSVQAGERWRPHGDVVGDRAWPGFDRAHGAQGRAAAPPRSTGLYHFAIRVPNRRALAMTIRHLEDAQWPVQGYADHDVSEAVYLADPDGIGLKSMPTSP
jgi:hypothetical protein